MKRIFSSPDPKPKGHMRTGVAIT